MNGPGEVMKTDAVEYRNPHYSRTLEISEQQYRKLEAFGAHPDKYGFDLQYKDVRNNCVDFTWEALNHAGIQRKSSIDVNALGGPAGQLLPDVRIPLDIKGRARTHSGRCATSTVWTALIRRFRTASSTRGKPIPAGAQSQATHAE